MPHTEISLYRSLHPNIQNSGGDARMDKGRNCKHITVTRLRETVLSAILLLFTVIIDAILFFISGNWIVTCILLPAILFEALFLSYYASWSISLTNKDVTIKKMFFRRKYSYIQLVDAVEYATRVGNSVLWLTFSDRKRYCLESTYRNYAKGRRLLTAHHTIRKKKG